jgi:cardiolipin synthase
MKRNIANFLTLFRIILIPILVALFYIEKPIGFITASLLFMVACVTDYLDGVVARATQQITSFGQFLDPLADKLIIAAALIMLTGFQRISGYALIPAVIILCREITVSGLREFLGAQNIPLPVSRLAKWKTALQMLSIGFLIVGDALPPLPFEIVGLYGLWIAAFFTIITGYDYLRQSVPHLR